MKLHRKAQSAERIKLTAKQSNIYAWGWQPEARFRDAVCGRRFGKTYLGAAEMRRAADLARRWRVSRDDEIWYAAPTFKQAKRVFWRRLKRSIPRSWIAGKPNESDCSILLRTGHVMRLVGLDAYDNLRGSGLFFVLVDEWADCPYEAWEEVLRPMLSTCRYWRDGREWRGGHALRIGTPKGFNHCYDTFLKGQPGYALKPGELQVHKSWLYTSLAGGNVPAEELAEARRDMDPRTFRQEYEASFENYAGRVYYAFERGPNCKACAFNPKLPIHVGMDFNVNPMSAVVIQEQPDGEMWVVDEIVIPTSNTDEMADEIGRRYGRPGFEPGKVDVKLITVYPDPAGAQRRTSAQGKTDISILRERGFTVIAMSSHPLVRDRVNLVNAKLCNAAGERKLFVDQHRCKHTVECLEKLCFKEGTNEPDKELDLDHLPDALGYYVFTKFAYLPAQRQQITHMGR